MTVGPAAPVSLPGSREGSVRLFGVSGGAPFQAVPRAGTGGGEKGKGEQQEETKRWGGSHDWMQNALGTPGLAGSFVRGTGGVGSRWVTMTR